MFKRKTGRHSLPGRMFALFMSLVLALILVPGGAIHPLEVQAATTLDISSANRTIDTSGEYIITGTMSGYRANTILTIKANVTAEVRLQNTTMLSTNSNCILVEAGAHVTFILDGTSSLHNQNAASAKAALCVEDTATAEFRAVDDDDSKGTLYSRCSSNVSLGGPGGAGIGGNGATPGVNFGSLIFHSGTIIAQGGCNTIGGAGIGSGGNGSAGADTSIQIWGGTIYAYSGGGTGTGGGAGIGCGNSGNAGKIYIYNGTITARSGYNNTTNLTAAPESGARTPSCGAGIGGAGGGSVDLVEIYGGTVRAYGGQGNSAQAGGSGIGGGQGGRAGQVLIAGGDIYAEGGHTQTATPANGSAGIGGGYNSNSASSVTITGGKVVAVGGVNSAGIGAGQNSDCGNIFIVGGDITARSYTSTVAGVGNGNAATRAAGSVVIMNLNENKPLVLDGTITHPSTLYLSTEALSGTISNGAQSYPTVELNAHTADGRPGAQVMVNLMSFAKAGEEEIFKSALKLADIDDPTAVELGITAGTAPDAHLLLYFYGTPTQKVTFLTDFKNPVTGGTYLPDEKSYNDMRNGPEKDVIFAYPEWGLEIDSIVSTAVSNLEYGYGDSDAVSRAQVITVTNTGTEELQNFTIAGLSGNFRTVVAKSPLGPGESTTIQVILNTSKIPGTYTPVSLSDVTVSAEASVTGTGERQTASDTKTNTLVAQVVVAKPVSGDGGGRITAQPGSDTAWKNHTQTLLTAIVDGEQGDSLKQWRYAIVPSTQVTPPANGDAAWSSWLTAVTQPANFSTIDGQYIIYWQLETEYTTGSSGRIAPYYLDRTPPLAVFTGVPGGTVNETPFVVTLTVSDQTGFAGLAAKTFTAADFEVVRQANGTVAGTITKMESASVEDWAIVSGIYNKAFQVTVQLNPAAVSTNDQVIVRLKSGVLQDLAENGNTSDEFTVTYDNDKPSVDYSDFAGKVYPDWKSGDSIKLTVSEALFDSANTPVTTGANTFFTLKLNGADIPFTASWNAATLTYTFTPSSPLADGTYTVAIADNQLKNAANNWLDASSATFQVLRPTVDSIASSQVAMSSAGGPITLTIRANNVYENTQAGNNVVLRVVSTNDQDATTNSVTVPLGSYQDLGDGYDTYTVTNVIVPANTSTANDYTWTYLVMLSDSVNAEVGTGKSVNIVVETQATYSFALSTVTFAPLNYGDAPVSQSVILTNTGNRDMSGFTASVNNASFQVVQPTGTAAANNGTIAFNVQPAPGLSAGTHTGQLTVTHPNGGTETISLSVMINKAMAGSGGTVTTPLTANTPTNAGSARLDIALQSGAGAVEGARYQVSTNATANPLGTWTSFTSGQSVSFPSPDADYYIHWELSTQNYPDTTGTLGKFLVDRSKPVIQLSYGGGTVNGSFTVTVTIQDIAGTNDQGFAANLVPTIMVENGTATAPTIPTAAGDVGPASVTFTVTPTIQGTGTVTVRASGIQDRAGNTADAATPLPVPFDDNKPRVTLGGFTEGQIFTTALPSFAVTASETLYSAPPTEVTAAEMKSRITMTCDGVSFTAFDVTKAGNVFTVVGDPVAFGEGAYIVTVADGLLVNQYNNELIGTDGSFQVRIPTINSISADITSHPSTGGTSVITIQGINLQRAASVQVHDGTTARNAVVSADGTRATWSVTLPENFAITSAYYTYTAWLNGSAWTPTMDVTVEVQDATPSITSFTADQILYTYEGGTTALAVVGRNLHNYPGLRIVETMNGTPGRTFPLSGLANGATTASQTVPLPQNISLADEVYTYELFDGVTSLGFVEVVTVEAATPVIGGGSGGSALTADPDWFDNQGGTTTLTVRGENLHNLTPFEIHDDHGGVYPISAGDISSDYRAARIQVTLPGNPALDDEEYLFELHAAIAGSGPAVPTGDTVLVTVEGSKPKVYTVTAKPNEHTSAGGNSDFHITGIYLENALPLELVDSLGGSHVVTNVAADGRSADIIIAFSGNLGPRNDIHEMEAYIAGEATGVSAAVEVGDSVPYVDGLYASPYELNQQQTLNGGGQVLLTITGGYLYGFDTLEIYDVVNQVTYTVTASMPQDDMTATIVVTVPSNEGVYTFQVVADGDITGHEAEVYVGVEVGYRNPDPDDTERPRDPDDKEWVGRGGGHKGAGFTGDYGGFDFLFHHAKQAVLQDGEDAAVTLQNVWFISKVQLDYASSGALEAKPVNGRVKLRFDTTKPGSTSQLEGRLILDPFEIKYSVYPTICTCEDETAHTRHLFQERFGAQSLAVVRLMQEGTFGAKVEVLASVNLNGMDTGTLYFYHYDRKTGEFNMLRTPDYSVDSSGFLHFFTTHGGDFVVVDTPLSQGGSAIAAGQLGAVENNDKEDGEE